MKENFWIRQFRNLGVAIIIVGVAVSAWKGLDRQDFFMGAEGVVLSVVFGTLLLSVWYGIGAMLASKGKKTPTEEYTEAYYDEIYEQKKKCLKKSGIVCIVSAVIYTVYFIGCVLSAPFEINALIEDEKYEQAFDAVMKSKLSENKKSEYREKLYPYMIAGFEREYPREVVLMIDDLKIVSRGGKLYLDDGVGYMDLLYTAGQYNPDAKAKFENDFIYSGGQLLFIEEVSTIEKLYKNIVVVDLKTKNHQILIGETNAFYFDKLMDGRVLVSDDPCLVYDPVTGRVEKKELKNEEWDYIYSTM